MRFCEGGGVKNKPLIAYHKQPIDYINEFIYVGVKLQTNLNPRKHLQHLVRKGIVATNGLAAELNLFKETLNSASRLFNAVRIPAASYGRLINLTRQMR